MKGKGFEDIIAAVKELEKLKRQARALGLFTDDEQLAERLKEKALVA